MFVGHAALALAAKAKAPRLSLGVLLGASFGIDLLWPVFLLLGLEQVRVAPGITAFTPLDFTSYPWSHSLLLVLVWAGLAGTVSGRVTRSRSAGLLVAALVLSHWALDAISHRPDLPLWPGAGAPLVGLRLWDSVPATFLVEGGLFAGGIAIYLKVTRATGPIGSLGLVALLLLCAVIWATGPYAPPPPGAAAVAWGALATWLLPAWGWWADRHRRARA